MVRSEEKRMNSTQTAPLLFGGEAERGESDCRRCFLSHLNVLGDELTVFIFAEMCDKQPQSSRSQTSCFWAPYRPERGERGGGAAGG